MTRTLVPAAILAAAVSGCAVSASAVAADPARTVSVAFGSEAMGIDADAYQRVAALAGDTALVASHEEKTWGREGERTLVFIAPDPKAAKALLAKVRAAIGDRVTKGYVDIAAPGKEIHIGNR